ncbi:MAG: hypothetical protein JSS61_02940 [Verrucomicrobia bacterium]|nr:hypothetical protein [Verrucomicrobiota bacterium]
MSLELLRNIPTAVNDFARSHLPAISPGGAASGAAAGYALGGIPGAAVGAAIGAVAPEYVKNKVVEKVQEIKDQVKDALTKQPDSLLVDLDSALKDLSSEASPETLQKASESIEKVIQNSKEIFQDADARAFISALYSLNLKIEIAKQTPEQAASFKEELESVSKQCAEHIESQKNLIRRGAEFVATAAKDTAINAVSISSLFNYALGYMKSGSVGTALPKKLMMLGIVTIGVLERALEYIEKLAATKPEFAPIRDALKAAMTKTNKGMEERNHALFEEGLKEAQTAVQSIQANINHFGVPPELNLLFLNIQEIFSGSAGPESIAEEPTASLDELVDQLDESHAAIPVPKSPKAFAEDIKLHRDQFIDNTTKYFILQHLYEFTCGLTPVSSDFYYQLIEETNKATDPYEALTTAFQNKLVDQNIGALKRLQVSFLFWFYSWLCHKPLQQSIQFCIDEVMKVIDKNKDKGFAVQRNAVIKNLNAYLWVVSGRLQSIGSSTEFKSDLNTMLSTELEKPEFNEGIPMSTWYDDLFKLITSEVSGGWLIRLFVWLLGGTEKRVRDLIDNVVSSNTDLNGYSHAINSVLLEELEVLWKEISSHRSGDPTANQEILEGFSDAMKKEMHVLVKNFFEVLHLSEPGSPRQLQTIVKGDSTKEKFLSGVDSFFIEDVVKATSESLAVALTKLCTKERLEDLFHRMTVKLNEIYKSGEKPSAHEIQRTERRVRLLTERIVNSAVHEAVEDSLQFTNEKEQTRVNEEIQLLSNQIDTFLETTRADLEELRSLDPLSPRTQEKILKIRGMTDSFLKICAKQKDQINMSEMSEDNRTLLHEIYNDKLARALAPYNQALHILIASSRTLHAAEISAPVVQKIQGSLANLYLALTKNDLSQQASQTEETIKSLEEELPKLPQELHPALKAHLTDLANGKRALATAAAVRALDSASAHPTLAEWEKHSAAVPTDLRTQLSPLLSAAVKGDAKALKAYRDALAISASQRELNGTLAIERTMQTVKTLQDTIQQEAKDRIEGKEREKNELGVKIEQARAGLEALNTWKAATLKPVLYDNLSVLPHDKIKEWAGRLIFNRVKAKSSGFLDFIRNPVHQRGLLNHVVVRPIVKAYKDTLPWV